MINISFKYTNSKFVSLSINGHADNLICAGVSSIFVGGMNCLDTKNYDISIVEGNSYCKVKQDISEHDKIVLDTIYIQLETIAQTYKKEVKLIKEN